MTYRKFFGSVIGFLGVAIVILDGAGGGIRSGSYLGECMVMGSNLTCAIAACLSNKYTKTIDPILLCGYQFIIGGIVMILIGVAGGGHIGAVVPTGCILLFYMGIISSVAFSIRMTLLKYNEVSRVIVYSFFTPLTGVIMSGIFLKEDAFKLSMFASLALVSWGIYIVNKKVG